MHQFFKKTFALICALGLTLGASGCVVQNEVINAYDIAVKNGFQGTEEEWLASLRGESGKDGDDFDIETLYQKAQDEDGFQGSLLEFVEEYFDIDLREDNDVKTIAKNVTSVVSIYSAFTTTTTQTQDKFPFLQETVIKANASAGSGVIINLDKEQGDALIITNYHVLYSAGTDTQTDISDCTYVYLYGARNYFTSGADTSGVLVDANGDGVVNKNDQGDWLGDGIKAQYVGGAMAYDIAILQVRGSEYLKRSAATAAEIGNSNAITVGEKVYAIGNARSHGISVTGGLISVESETIEMESLDGTSSMLSFRVMRTDAAINSGNSGGGLFDANGKLVGITNAKNVQEATDNMGYALPISQIEKIVENITDHGGVLKRAMFGVATLVADSIATVDENGKLILVEKLEVAEVLTTGAAYGKLKVGDIFRSMTIGGKTIELTQGYLITDWLFDVRKGDSVSVTVYRPSQNAEITVTITYDKDSYFTIYS